jgi:hypothetical protein
MLQVFRQIGPNDNPVPLSVLLVGARPSLRSKVVLVILAAWIPFPS